jgi:hypothetical protein
LELLGDTNHECSLTKEEYEEMKNLLVEKQAELQTKDSAFKTELKSKL